MFAERDPGICWASVQIIRFDCGKIGRRLSDLGAGVCTALQAPTTFPVSREFLPMQPQGLRQRGRTSTIGGFTPGTRGFSGLLPKSDGRLLGTIYLSVCLCIVNYRVPCEGALEPSRSVSCRLKRIYHEGGGDTNLKLVRIPLRIG